MFDVDGIHPDSYHASGIEIVRPPYQDPLLGPTDAPLSSLDLGECRRRPIGRFHALGLAWSHMSGSLDASVPFVTVEFKP